MSPPTISASIWPWSTPVTPNRQPLPAVARISVTEDDGTVFGSGTLVDVRDEHGMVVTNWHVVRDATGPISVIFPDGFRSAARVLRVDRDWDLAALLIWRPPAPPMPLATQAPQPGDAMTVAGYGAGDYREASGRCTQYLAPSDHHPFELVEVSASARQGDSGGPILNASGELAGVLFGSDGSTTSGSYAGRVYHFLQTAWPPQHESISVETPASNESATPQHTQMQRLPAADPDRSDAASSITQMKPLPPIQEDRQPPRNAPFLAESLSPEGFSTVTDSSQSSGATITWQEFAGDSPLQQGKTFLAILGLFTLITQFTRFLTPR